MILRSTQHSSVLSSLDQLVKGNGQQDLQRNSEFKELRHAGLEALKELQEIHKLHSNLLEHAEKRDSAIIESLKKLSTKLDGLVTFGDKISTEHLILESLCYKRMAVRHEKVVDAHTETFGWIYHD